MIEHYVLTIICDDRPGVVERLANTIKQHGGNWLESRMAQLAGKFAGILHCSVSTESAAELCEALGALRRDGITVVVERGSARLPEEQPVKLLQFSIVGNDRPGIVREVTQAFARRQINLEELNSELTSAPHTGIPLFEANGVIRLPKDTDISDLESNLDSISNELAVDIQLEGAD